MLSRIPERLSLILSMCGNVAMMLLFASALIWTTSAHQIYLLAAMLVGVELFSFGIVFSLTNTEEVFFKRVGLGALSLAMLWLVISHSESILLFPYIVVTIITRFFASRVNLVETAHLSFFALASAGLVAFVITFFIGAHIQLPPEVAAQHAEQIAKEGSAISPVLLLVWAVLYYAILTAFDILCYRKTVIPRLRKT